MATCGNCHFCGSYHSFRGKGRSAFGFRCDVLDENIFEIGSDEAKMTGVPILADFRDDDGRYLKMAEDETLYGIKPMIFEGLDAAFNPDRAAFWAWVLDCPCLVSADGLRDYIREYGDYARQDAKDYRDSRERLETRLQNIRAAAKMRRAALQDSDDDTGK